MTILWNWRLECSGRIFSSRKLYSELSQITDFCFYLTFAVKYYFHCMRSRHFGCIFQCYKLFAIESPLLGLRQFSVAESSLKVMNKAYYFILKALFVLKILNFRSDFLVK